MKHLLLFWTHPLPEGAQQPEGFGTEADYQAWTDFQARLEGDGSYVDSGDLEPPPSDRLVRPDLAADPASSVSPPASGPVVSGYYVIDVADAAAARAVAASVPLHGTVEVRPVVDHSGGW